MDYDFYLFVQLRMEFIQTITEYDLQFGDDLAMYDEFLTSSFNDEDKPLYECICDFLADKL